MIKLDDEPLPMMQGKFKELKKMSSKEKDIELEAWRNLWGYLDSAVKYYLLKSGTTVGVTMRNYKRHIGVLLSTRWDIKEMELGVFEKEYDQNTGEYFFERKVIKVNPQSFLDIQWIAERIKDTDMQQQQQEQQQPMEEQQEQNTDQPPE